MSQKQKKQKRKVVNLDSLEQINLDAAGLDIGAEEIYACVPEGQDTDSVRCFGTFTVDLHALAKWLRQCGVTTVAMESTGVYWIPVYEVLTEYGFELYLVNARHIKNVPGKKSDVLDCQWIQQLHTYGLLQASFRPDEDMCAVRALVRHRDNLIRYRAAHIQHMQKELEQMNLKLVNVVADVTGVTGMTIIRAILRGERDPKQLAQYRQPGCCKSEETIAKALEGNYRDEHLFALKQAVELFDFYTQQMRACDEELEAKYSALKPQIDIEQDPLPLPRQKQRKGKDNNPLFDLRTELYKIAGVDLTQIDGINALTAQKVITEIGVDVSKWPTVKHFTSWLRLCPNNKITGGRVRRRGRLKGNNRAAQALRMAAQGLSRSQSALGAYYRRMRAKHGPAKANVAAAHKLARIVYYMLKNKTPYRDVGPEAYDKKYRQRMVRNLERQARRLGLHLEPLPIEGMVS
jgi:transposase